MNSFYVTHTFTQQAFAGHRPCATVFRRVAVILKARKKRDWGDMPANNSVTKVRSA